VKLKVGLALITAVILSSCGSSQALKGDSKLPDIDLSSMSMTEVTSPAASQPFVLKAQPKDLLVLYLGYTSCPDLCPTTLADLRSARQTIGTKNASRVSLAFATVDQGNDTAPVLLSYTNRFGFGPNDHSLRPTDTDLTNAEKALFATSQTNVPDGNGGQSVNHTAWTYVVDSHGRVVDEWDYGTTSADMAHDLKTLLSKQSA
jgi:protein SCO1